MKFNYSKYRRYFIKNNQKVSFEEICFGIKLKQ